MSNAQNNTFIKPYSNKKKWKNSQSTQGAVSYHYFSIQNKINAFQQEKNGDKKAQTNFKMIEVCVIPSLTYKSKFRSQIDWKVHKCGATEIEMQKPTLRYVK